MLIKIINDTQIITRIGQWAFLTIKVNKIALIVVKQSWKCTTNPADRSSACKIAYAFSKRAVVGGIWSMTFILHLILKYFSASSINSRQKLIHKCVPYIYYNIQRKVGKKPKDCINIRQTGNLALGKAPLSHQHFHFHFYNQT